MLNLVVLLAYFAVTLGIGLYMSRYVKDDTDYFLAGRSLNKWIVAGTIMATNIAAIYLVGPAGAAYAGGVPVLLIAWTGNMLAAVSALFFVPRLRRLGITTISEFLEERYGLWLRLLPTLLWICYYALFSGNSMYTFAVSLKPVLESALPEVKLDAIIVVVGGIVVLYCFIAGLPAVVYTDVLQSFVIMLGGIILLPLALKAVGGVSGFATQVPAGHFVFWRASGEWPTYKDVIMFTLLGLPYWCTSQYMLQRSFAARSARAASRGLAIAALLTGFLTLSYILPGVAASAIYTGEKTLARPDSVLAQLFVDILPAGLGGIFVAGLIAASNSTASSLLNSLATLAEHDLYRRFLPAKGSRAYLLFGRAATLAGGLVGLIFAFNVERLGGIIRANFKIMSFFEPPIFVIVAGALFWKHVNAWGAGAALAAGVLFNAAAGINWLGSRGAGPMLDDAMRTIIVFPLCLAALLLGSVLGRKKTHPERQAKLHALYLRMSGAGPAAAGVRRIFGMASAGAALALFAACALFEQALPKPANILIFFGLMLAFIAGCYIAIPAFVPAEDEDKAGSLQSELEASRINRLFGSGRTWLAIYLAAAALMLALYLW